MGISKTGRPSLASSSLALAGILQTQYCRESDALGVFDMLFQRLDDLLAEIAVVEELRQAAAIGEMSLSDALEIENDRTRRDALVRQVIGDQLRVEILVVLESDDQHGRPVSQVACDHGLWRQASRSDSSQGRWQEPVAFQAALQTGSLPLHRAPEVLPGYLAIISNPA